MSDEEKRQLERQLADLSQWRGGETQLWHKALEEAEHERAEKARAGQGRSPLMRIFLWRIPPAIGAAAAAVIVVAIAAALLLPGTHLARDQAVSYSLDARAARRAPESPLPASRDNLRNLGTARANVERSWGEGAGGAIGGGDAPPTLFSAERLEPGEMSQILQAVQQAVENNALPAERHVIRKATMELIVEDVHAAFLKASHLVSAASGEFVESSTVAGEGRDVRAELVLRIAVDRLSAVLNELRALGEVSSEQTSGEDVTSQVVDLEARIRNEQRIEQEMLELLEKREDAPLKEILELRSQLSRVRQSVERLQGQREHLSRMVSLATVLLIIRPEDAPTEEEESALTPIGEYFAGAASASWRGGLLFLADSVTGLLKVIVGGLMWWVLLIAVFAVIRHHWRRARALAGY